MAAKSTPVPEEQLSGGPNVAALPEIERCAPSARLLCMHRHRWQRSLNARAAGSMCSVCMMLSPRNGMGRGTRRGHALLTSSRAYLWARWSPTSGAATARWRPHAETLATFPMAATSAPSSCAFVHYRWACRPSLQTSWCYHIASASLMRPSASPCFIMFRPPIAAASSSRRRSACCAPEARL